MSVRTFFLFFLAILFGYNNACNAAEVLTEESTKNLILRFQTALNSYDQRDRDLFFRYYVDNAANIIVENRILDPNNPSVELSSESVTMNPTEYARYIELIRKPNYKHLYRIESSEVIVEPKSKTGVVAINIQEYALRKQEDKATGAQINDMTILASTNCNVNVADNTNDVVITSMNCIGKIIEYPMPLTTTQQ